MQQEDKSKWLFLLLLVTVLYFWNLLFTGQFSTLLGWEVANQAYAWDHFAARSLQQGILPIWDPFTFCGRSFVGEMQTALFYPLKLVLYFWPFQRTGLLLPRLLDLFYVFAHFLAACFMFLLVEELGLARLSAFVAGICFGLGGFVGRVQWPNILDSAIWLPLIFLCLIRAFRSEGVAQQIRFACLAGLAQGMVILAGSLHVAIMDALVVVSAAAYFIFRPAEPPGARQSWQVLLRRGAVIIALIALVAFAVSAIQLLPSIEYSQLAVRWLGDDGPPLPVTQKIPYARLSETDRLLPRGVLALIFGVAEAGGEIHPHFGVLPFLLVIIGIWRNWDKLWVKYLAALAVLSFFYALGSYSFLHGLLYGVVPFLDKAREADRFVYLGHFAMAILAGFGAGSLFRGDSADQQSFAGLARILKWTTVIVLLVLGIPALYGTPRINEWLYVSLWFIIASYGLFVFIIRGHRTTATQLLLIALILCDLQIFNWTPLNRLHRQKQGNDYFSALVGSRELADFFKTQPGPFRVYMAMDLPPNIGDLYGVETIGGAGATMLADYYGYIHMMPKVPRLLDLLNVRYIVRKGSFGSETPVYSREDWVVYENPSCLPRAWVVHEVAVEASSERARGKIAQPNFDPRRMALVAEPLETQLEPAAAIRAEIRFGTRGPNRLELRVKSESRGLLVLSEVHYPGWEATVNGRPTPIHKVDGLFRGVVVPSGESQVALRYAPRSVFLGALLTVFGILVTLALAVALKKREKRLGGNATALL